MSPNSLANLEKHRFKKGEIHNPNGRPKNEACITSCLREFAYQLLTMKVDASKLTFAQAAALKHWQQAVKGDLDTYKFIAERTEGKVGDSLDLTTKGESIKQTYVNIPDARITEAINILGQSGITISKN